MQYKILNEKIRYLTHGIDCHNGLFATTRKVVAFWSQKVARNGGLWAYVGSFKTTKFLYI